MIAWRLIPEILKMNATIIAEGIGWPEGLRWHDGKLWFSDVYGSRKVHTLDSTGQVNSILYVPGSPSGLGWTPNGDLLVVSMDDCKLLRLASGVQSPTMVCDLSRLARATNDMAVMPDGTAYIGDNGFLFGQEEPAQGRMIKVSPDGQASIVAEGMCMPNGIAITPDCDQLIVAETFGSRHSRFVIAENGDLGPRETFHAFDELGWVTEMDRLMQRPAAPDGICLNADGAVWVGNPLRPEVLCVSSDGEVVDRVELSQTGIACMLGGPERRTLYVATGTMADMAGSQGKIEACEVKVPGAGYPNAN
jgi:sugar lactone lactonase YvrE